MAQYSADIHACQEQAELGTKCTHALLAWLPSGYFSVGLRSLVIMSVCSLLTN